jgi:hypothetical protein
MARLTLKATNLPSVQRAMRGFSDELEGELGTSLRAGMEFAKAKAVYLAPKQSRKLAHSIYVRTYKARKGWASNLGANTPYARIREYGGIIRARNGQYLKFRARDGRFVQVRQVTQRATPYLQPAIRQSRAQIVTELQRGMQRAAGTISKAAR